VWEEYGPDRAAPLIWGLEWIKVTLTRVLTTDGDYVRVIIFSLGKPDSPVLTNIYYLKAMSEAIYCECRNPRWTPKDQRRATHASEGLLSLNLFII